MYKNSMRKIREKKGITLTKLSKETGISIGYLSHLEKGTRKNPSVSTMDKISKLLNESVTKIFFDM